MLNTLFTSVRSTTTSEALGVEAREGWICRGFLHFVGQFQMWGTRPEAPPDPKVNTAICLDELLHLPMFHQTYWWTCIFFGRHNWPLNFVRWVLPSLQYRRREKTFFNKKINFKIGSGSLLRGLSSLQHCRWCRRLAFTSGDCQVGAYGIDTLPRIWLRLLAQDQ